MVSRRGTPPDTSGTRGGGWGGRYFLLVFGLSAAFLFGFLMGFTTPTTVLLVVTDRLLDRAVPPMGLGPFFTFILLPVLMIGYSVAAAAVVVAIVHGVRKWRGW